MSKLYLLSDSTGPRAVYRSYVSASMAATELRKAGAGVRIDGISESAIKADPELARLVRKLTEPEKVEKPKRRKK